jgi:hypothetical protein
MVYEQLPIKTAHHTAFDDSRYTTNETSHGDDKGLTLVYPTIAGIKILCTCREINNEASAVLKPRLAKLKSKPSSSLSGIWPVPRSKASTTA